MKSKKPKTIFGYRLEKLMDERGISGPELADILGKERKTIYRLKFSDNGPTLRDLVIMARHFGVSIDYLAGLTNDRVPAKRIHTDKLDKKPEGQKFFTNGWEV